MTADPKPDAVTADHLREMARLCRPCACDYGCRHDVARGKIHDLGGWHTIAMKLLDEADELRTELAEALKKIDNLRAVSNTYYENSNEQFHRANKAEKELAEAEAWDAISAKNAEIARLHEQLADMGRENNLLKYGPPHIGMSLERIMSDDLREQLAEAERQRDAARAEALEEAAQHCDMEADNCDDAVKWGGSRRYISDCKAAAYAMRNRAAAIRALIKEDRT